MVEERSGRATASSRTEVVVIGAGLAGLTCARRLTELGIPFVLLEASDRVGGRVATDLVDGYRLDRGFQVLLDSYPEARRNLDLEKLATRPFAAGALVWRSGRFWRIVDPWRAPLSALTTLRAPFVSLADAGRMALLRRRAVDEGARTADGTALEHLRQAGFSDRLIEGFFRPFFAGSTLDPDLGVPAAWFLSLFGFFARGSAVLPAEGMQAIPEQLAAALTPGALRLSSRVTSLSQGAVELDSGERIECREVVLAADASAAGKVLGVQEEPDWLGTTTLYYAADRSPVGEPILVLNGEGAADGPVNHLAVLSDAQPSYAPRGSSLISVSALGIPSQDDEQLDEAARAQLVRWYGPEVRSWRRIRVDRIERALPRHTSSSNEIPRRPGLHVCGDHVASPSIQGSMESGRSAAEAVRTALHPNSSR